MVRRLPWSYFVRDTGATSIARTNQTFIAVSIPSAPGLIGTFQFFSVAALALFGVDEGHAFGFSLIFQFSQFLPITLIGWFLLLREHMVLSDLAAVKK
jgi:uncharacterized membrane protein YbhN (UPF0104 family)